MWAFVNSAEKLVRRAGTGNSRELGDLNKENWRLGLF